MSSDLYERIRAAGHLLKLDSEGEIDDFALDVDYHNGPMCELCYESWCEHCDRGGEIDRCSESVIDSTCTRVELIADEQ